MAQTAYYGDAALWASEKGLLAGTTLVADTPCTRSMVVTYLWRLAGQPAATKATTFAPDGVCTRGQTVTFLFLAMDK